MEEAKKLVEIVTEKLTTLAKESAVLSQPIAVDGRYVVPICSLGMGYGGGGGGGNELTPSGEEGPGGSGMGGGGGAGVKPLAVLIVDGDQVRIESLQD